MLSQRLGVWWTISACRSAWIIVLRNCRGRTPAGGGGRALVNDPMAVLADEPSGSLDSRNRAELHKLFFDLRRDFGQTFVIVTHDENLAADTDLRIMMADGMITSIETK